MTELPTGAERVAIISDIHGNLTALEAVLSHIASAGISRIFNLGDLVGKGPRSAAVVDRCRETCEVIIRGNWDDMVVQDEAAAEPVLQWHRAQLGGERLRYLAGLPGSYDFMLSGHRVRLFHASQIGIYHRVYETAERAKQSAMFGNTEFTGFGPEPEIVGYGDIHCAYMMNFERRTLFNVGSVGNPLDLPLACYAVLEGWFGAASAHPWSLHFVRVPYDVESEIAVAEACGMPALDNYASELRTAVYRGRTD